MATVSELSYIVEQDETEARLETAEQDCDLLDRLATGASADLWVLIDRDGARALSNVSSAGSTGWSLRASTWRGRETWPLSPSLTTRGASTGQYPDRPAKVSDEIRHKLSGGEPTSAAPDVCMTASRAFAAARHSLLRGARPEWLSYRYVR
jgi:hypothetical protein